MTAARYRTEGGAVILLGEPLPPVFAAQVRRGELVRVDGPISPASAVVEPAPSDDKGRWEEYAVALGLPAAEARAASKPDLIARLATPKPKPKPRSRPKPEDKPDLSGL